MNESPEAIPVAEPIPVAEAIPETPPKPDSVRGRDLLAGVGIKHQDDLVGGGSVSLGGYSLNLFKLLHQVKLGVQPAGGIDNYLLRLPAACRLQGIKDHRPGISTGLVANNIHANFPTQLFELVDSRRPEGISGHQQHPLALFFGFVSQLGDRGGLAAAVNTHR